MSDQPQLDQLGLDEAKLAARAACDLHGLDVPAWKLDQIVEVIVSAYVDSDGVRHLIAEGHQSIELSALLSADAAAHHTQPAA